MAGESSFGVVLQYGNAAGDFGNYANMSYVINVTAPKPKKETYSKKTLTQSDRWDIFGGAFVDGGELTLSVSYDKTQHAAMYAMLPDTDPRGWRIVVPDHATFGNRSCLSFGGLLTDGPGLDFPEDGGRMMGEITVKVSGAVTFTAGS